MKKFLKKEIAFLLLFTIVSTGLSANCNAIKINAQTVYTGKLTCAVTLRDKPSKYSKLTGRSDKKGTVLTFLDKEKNEYGNVWYKVQGQGWVYEGNLCQIKAYK